MADQPAPQRSQVERWVSFGATIVAPITVLSAVLFYFGYVSSREQYQYFGVDVDTIGLSTRDYVMRSPQPLPVPLLVLTLVGVGGLALHTTIRSRIASAVSRSRPDSASDLARLRQTARRAVGAGVITLGAGVVLLFAYPYVRDWSLYNLVTPLIIGAGAAVICYASYVVNLASVRAAGGVPLRRAIAVLLGIVIVASTFWATATVAQWSGRGIARYDARHLDRFPSVILDTKERLYLTDGCQRRGDPGSACIEETALPTGVGQVYRFRYRHFRLLIQGHDRLFLVPDAWSASNSTLVVPLDGSVRVQFQFQNEAP